MPEGWLRRLSDEEVVRKAISIALYFPLLPPVALICPLRRVTITLKKGGGGREEGRFVTTGSHAPKSFPAVL